MLEHSMCYCQTLTEGARHKGVGGKHGKCEEEDGGGGGEGKRVKESRRLELRYCCLEKCTIMHSFNLCI